MGLCGEATQICFSGGWDRRFLGEVVAGLFGNQLWILSSEFGVMLDRHADNSRTCKLSPVTP